MKKLTYEYVKFYIESFGYKLLSKEYKNSRSEIEIKCDKNHIYKTTFSKFRSGYRCLTCVNNNKRNSIYYVRSIIEKNGFELLSSEYENTKTKLKVRCKNGHIYRTSFMSIRNGRDCPYCSKNKVYIPDYIEQCEKIGYTFLKITRNNSVKIHFICDSGHKDSLVMDYWKRGIRCRYCDDKKIYWKDIMWELYENGWLMLNRKNKHKITSKTKLKLKCRKCGFIWYSSFLKFRKLSKNCFWCQRQERIENYVYKAEQEGYTLLSRDHDCLLKNAPVFYICNKNHLWCANFVNWNNKQRCGECWLEELKKRVINNRKIMRGKKLYDNLVNFYTKESLKNYHHIINPDDVELNWENTIDHKYSKKQGYIDGILPQIIGSFVNLEIMNRNLNSSKNYKCSITKDELFDYYDKYELKKGDNPLFLC